MKLGKKRCSTRAHNGQSHGDWRYEILYQVGLKLIENEDHKFEVEQDQTSLARLWSKFPLYWIGRQRVAMLRLVPLSMLEGNCFRTHVERAHEKY